jgi:hypothetical protein
MSSSIIAQRDKSVLALYSEFRDRAELPLPLLARL